ncbi:sugar transferase [Chitinophagaceae bacterium LWZ2-11]
MGLSVRDIDNGTTKENFRRINGYTSSAVIKRFTNTKNYCLIINPGNISWELAKQSKFQRFYSPEFWEGQFKGDSVALKDCIKDRHSVILIDPSGNDKLANADLNLINGLRLDGKNIYSVASFFEHITGRIPLIHLSQEWVVNNDLFFVSTRWKFRLLKRSLDLFFSILLLPIATVLTSVGIVLTMITSKGPALFIQKRVGRNGKVFKIYKIRTMKHAPKGYTQHTVKNDNRVTPIGKFLRLSKIDELPQLINILKGDMSLIGPRPERDDIVEKMVKENPYYHLRHTIKPGVSGWAQIHNPTATPEQNLEKLEYDLYYVKNMSVFLDLKVLIKTIKIVFTFDSL